MPRKWRPLGAMLDLVKRSLTEASQSNPHGKLDLSGHLDYAGIMTKLEFSIELPDRLAREARDAGLLAPAALAELLESGLRQQAAKRIAAARSRSGGTGTMSLTDLQAIVASVRKKTA